MTDRAAEPRPTQGTAAGPVALSIRDVALRFGGLRALDGVNLDVGRGRVTGLVGPNGAGKTTLFNVVSGLYRAQAGTITYAGHRIERESPHRISRRGLVRTFQIARGFPALTVFEHLMVYGVRQPGERLVAAIVGSTAARHREQELAEKALAIAARLRLSAVIDHRVTDLSGGQKKLLEIGRALMADPGLILFDEPAAGVNPTLAEEIGDALASLAAEGLGILLIEHDMALIERICGHVIVMAQAKTLAEGRFDEVRENREVQDAYLGGRR